MRSKQLRAGAILSYAQMAVQIIVGVLYTPLMIKLLGQSEYGLYNTVASTISMISILNLGFSSGYIKFFSKYRLNNDQLSIDRLNGLYLIVFSTLGIIALACGLYLTLNLNAVFDSGLTKTEYATARVLMLLLSFNLAISFPMNVFQCIINAHERFIVLKTIGMIKTVLTPILTIPILMLGYGSIGLVAISVLLSVVTDIAYISYSFIALRVGFVFKGFEKGLFSNIFYYTSFVALNIITDQINWNIDKFILGRFCGTIVVAVYSIGATFQSYYQMFSLAVSNVFIPTIHRTVNNNADDREKMMKELSDIFIKVGRIQYLILALIISGFVFWGKTFIKFWAGNGYDDSYTIALLLMLPVTVPLIQNIGTEIQRALNLHPLRSAIYFFMALFNLVITIYLSQKFGAIGAALGTTISLIISTGIIMNLLYWKVLKIDIVRFWENIIDLSKGLIIPIGIGILLNRIIIIRQLITLIICILIYSCVYFVSMYCFGMNSKERHMVISIVRKINKRD